MDKWLQRRLTPVKQDTPLWRVLNEAIEELWDGGFAPLVQEREAARSIFTASPEEVDIRLSEMGTQFEAAFPLTAESKAMAYAQRGYEIHRKDRADTMNAILQRDFGGAVIRWLPLKAPLGEPYGSRFLNEFEIRFGEIDPDTLWQTSRGKVVVDVAGARRHGYTKQSITEAVDRKMGVLRPAHIVFDGILFIAIYRFKVEPMRLYQGITSSTALSHYLTVNPFWSLRFDEQALDTHPLDSWSPLTLHTRSSTLYPLSAAALQQGPWTLDRGAEINGSYRPIVGTEGDTVHALNRLATDSQSRQTLPVTAAEVLAGPAVQQSQHQIPVNPLAEYRFDSLPLDSIELDRQPLRIGLNRSLHHGASLGVFNPWLWHLDIGAEINGSYRPVAGIEGETASVLSRLATDSRSIAAPLCIEALSSADAPAMSHSVISGVVQPAAGSRADSSASATRLDLLALQQGPWTLDRGAEINGSYRPIVGTEGDTVQSLNRLATDSQSSQVLTIEDTALKPADNGTKTAVSVPVNPLRQYRLDYDALDQTPLDAQPLTAKVSYQSETTARIAPVSGGHIRSRTQQGRTDVLTMAATSTGIVSRSAARLTFFPIQASHQRASQKTAQMISYRNGDRPETPKLDELPLDFAPLDTRYSDA
ncbi:MAG: hypothetical protein OIF57_06625 [Marinobacterium sp.]|nr:hypothetical protein [Marinobacterium sp.]